jgi:hypothetical protein
VAPNTLDLQLQQPLKDWLPDSAWLQACWIHYYEPTHKQLFICSRHNSYLLVYPSTLAPSIKGKPTCLAFHKATCNHPKSLPPNAVPVDCEDKDHYFVISLSLSQQHPPTNPVPAPTLWTHYIKTLDPWEQELRCNFKFMNKVQVILLLQSKQQIFFASDGGAADPYGSFGCLIANKKQILVEGGGQACSTNP